MHILSMNEYVYARHKTHIYINLKYKIYIRNKIKDHF